MFKVPDWESDIPKSNVFFSKKVKSKKADQVSVASSQHVILNPQGLKDKQPEHLVRHETVGDNTKKKSKKHKKKKKFTNAEDNKTVHKISQSPVVKASSVNGKKNKSKFNKVQAGKEPIPVPVPSAKIGKTSKMKIASMNSPDEVKTNKKAKKRKLEGNPNSTSPINGDADAGNALVKAKKIKFTDSDNVDSQKSAALTDSISIDSQKVMGNMKKNNSKKEKLKKMLGLQHRSTIHPSGNKLRERMLDRLKAAQFRYLNEKLYTSNGNEAKEIFQSDPEAFNVYHQGYQLQVKKWPVNPLDVIVKKIQKMPKTFTIADMGCGEAALSRRVPHTVKSFDLVAASAAVTACDMAHTPLLTASVDAVVYCLALMGTELALYLVEANRVLKTGGHLLIAEVESRFDDVNAFTKDVEKLGFKLKELNKEHSVFFFLHFLKNREPPAKKSKMPQLQLKPCLYKKR